MKSSFFFVIGFSSLLLLSCNECDNSQGGSITASTMGSWKLTQINSPKKSQTSFPYKEVLALNWMSLFNTSNYNEVTIRDSTKVLSLDFTSIETSCNDNAFVVFYNTGLQRKYWLDSNVQLEATGYVNKIGGAADTLRYFYTKIQ